MADKSPWYDRIASDEEGKPVKMKYVGKHLKNGFDAVTEGTGKFVTGDFDGADESYKKAKSRRVDIEKEQAADRPKYDVGGKVKEGLDTVKDTFRLGYESLYKGDKQAEKDHLERKKSKVDPYGGDRTPGPSTLPKPDMTPAKPYANGGSVRGVGAAQRGYGKGKIC